MRTVYRSMRGPPQSAAQQHTCGTHKMWPVQLSIRTFKVSPCRAWQASFSGTGGCSTVHAKHTLVLLERTNNWKLLLSPQPLSFCSGALRFGTLATNTVNKSEQDTNVFLRHQASAELLGVEAWDGLHMSASTIMML